MDKHVIELYDRTTIPVRAFSTMKATVEGSVEEVKEAVKDAIDIGYRNFVCASVYGTQAAVGEAIKEKIQQGVVRRNQLFITSKLWCTQHRPDLVKPALNKTLKELQLDYIDLYLLYWPHALKEGSDPWPLDSSGQHIVSFVDFIDTWQAMIRLKPEARKFGIGNFNSGQIHRLLTNECCANDPPVVNYIELHPFLTQKRLKQYCAGHNIVIMAHSPLAIPARFWKNPGPIERLDDVRISVIAFRYGRTRAQILIRYSIQLGNVVVSQSFDRTTMVENFFIFDFTLTEHDMRELSSLSCCGRLYTMPESKNHPDYPFRSNIYF